MVQYDDDRRDIARRVSEGLARSAERAYQAAHGNPIPDEARGVRFALGLRDARVVAALIALVAVLVWWSVRPVAVVEVPRADSVGAEHVAAAPVEAMVVVHVAGAVLEPGVYALAPGERVNDAVDLAGGLTDEADEGGVNLARQVRDGEQIYIPRRGEEETLSRVNINRASADQLTSLPGIGEVLAQRIVAYRDEHGGFESLADLTHVPGVGSSVVSGLGESATV